MMKLGAVLLLTTTVLQMADRKNDLYHRQSVFVSSLSPPQRHQKIIISIPTHRCATNANAKRLSYGFKVVDQCPVQNIFAKNDEATAQNIDKKSSIEKNHPECSLDMFDVLMKWNPNGAFPSKSQARRSLGLGKILLFNTTSFSTGVSSTYDDPAEKMKKHKDGICLAEDLSLSLEDLQPHIGSITSPLEPHTVVVLMEPIPSLDRYPISVTKYMFPPVASIGLVPIIYEDEYLAVVNKPENMTTIGGTNGSSNGIGTARTNDLQSVLGFLLRPSLLDPTYHPRPVHRLDRRTSGLVLIAKTQSSMRTLSRAFATRVVTKTYSALVFERQRDLTARLGGVGEDGLSSSTDSKKWLVVDYPIDNREAISEIRRVTAPISSSASSLLAEEKISNGHIGDVNHNRCDIFSLVDVRPKTGRTHQIRRHLSYCLGMPIVGDSKYDGGARHLRTNGMYLCCHSLRFPHTHPMTSVADADASSIYNNVHISPGAIVEWIHGNSDDDKNPLQETSNVIGTQLSIHITLPDKFSPWVN